jgi:type IV secretory pathway VirB3-like protein
MILTNSQFTILLLIVVFIFTGSFWFEVVAGILYGILDLLSEFGIFSLALIFAVILVLYRFLKS